MIKFEYVNRMISTGNEFITPDFELPKRATQHSAGYDFFCPEDVVIPPKEAVRVMTGVKCELLPDQVLIVANRSSNPKNKSLVLLNGIGVVDADYYSNPDNDGEIGFEFYNISDKPVEIKKCEKLGQGIIMRYIKTEDDITTGVRVGGFGSTDKK